MTMMMCIDCVNRPMRVKLFELKKRKRFYIYQFYIYTQQRWENSKIQKYINFIYTHEKKGGGFESNRLTDHTLCYFLKEKKQNKTKQIDKCPRVQSW